MDWAKLDEALLELHNEIEKLKKTKPDYPTILKGDTLTQDRDGVKLVVIRQYMDQMGERVIVAKVFGSIDRERRINWLNQQFDVAARLGGM